MGLYPAAVMSHCMRSSMLDVMSADYFRTARAKGLFEWLVNARHAVRNAPLPILIVPGMVLPNIINGFFSVEALLR